jgi:hypothetical protein
METITGIEIFPVISFLIFFLFFVVLCIWLIIADKESLREQSQIPLTKNDSTNPSPDLL